MSSHVLFHSLVANTCQELSASDEEPRTYPDDEIWTSSMLDFI